MSRFVVRYRGAGEIPADTAKKIRAAGATIVESTGRMLLVEAGERDLRGALGSERDWLVTPEVAYPSPDPRETIK